MKRTAFILCAFFLIMTVVACDFAGISIDLGGGGGEKAPTSHPQSAAPVEVGIDGPANGAALQMGPVDIAYHASSTEGVSLVELSIDGAVVSSINSPDASQKVVALRYSWNPPAPGSHTLQVRAQSKTGAWSNFAISAVTIQGAQPTAQPQATQAPQATSTPEPTKTLEPTATPKDVTIYDVKANKDIFYYGGGGCNRELTISAKVTQPEKAKVVILFIRLVDKEGEGNSGWDGGRAMSKKGDGEYSVTLFSEKILHYSDYDFSSMNYQIVVQGFSDTRIAASEVFRNVSLHTCS